MLPSKMTCACRMIEWRDGLSSAGNCPLFGLQGASAAMRGQLYGQVKSLTQPEAWHGRPSQSIPAEISCLQMPGLALKLSEAQLMLSRLI